jgi:glycopeptide antibiotics resistance protein
VNGVPWFWPGVVLAIIVGIALSAPAAGWLGIRRPLAWALLVAVGIILATTLTPLRAALETGASSTMTCDFSRLGPAPFEDLTTVGDTSLNVLLFVPLGTVVGLLPRSRRKLVVALGVIALPFAIETAQLLAVGLDRGCQSADVVDNLSGLLVGLALGTGMGWLASRSVVSGRTG